MIKSAIGRFWRGTYYGKGAPMPQATPAQAEAMLACGQAYVDQVPTADHLKSEIQDYLKTQGIEFTTAETKQELLDKINDSERNS